MLGGKWGHLTPEKLPRSKKSQFSLNQLCFTVSVALLGSCFGTAGPWTPYKSNSMSLSADFDIGCVTSPCSYLLSTVKSGREAIKVSLKSFPATPNQQLRA